MPEQPSIQTPQINRRRFLAGMGLASSTLLGARGAAASETPRVIPGRRLTRFAHLTDLHFTNRTQNRYPTSHYHIRQAVADLNQQDLDFVLFTGDMFHFTPDIEAEMPLLRDALSGLKHPYYCVIGNHDAQGEKVAARKRFLSEHMGDRGLSLGEPYYHFAPAAGLRIVVLDTTDVPDDTYKAWTGHLGDGQLRWLDKVLTQAKDESVFLAMHHPPITPYPFMERLKFETRDQAALADVLAGHRNVQLAFAGHYHFGGRNRFGNAELLLGPSLVEHPHPYRVVDVHHIEGKEGAITYHWRTLNLHGDHDDACAFGSAGVRSLALMGLSYMHDGLLPLALPG